MAHTRNITLVTIILATGQLSALLSMFHQQAFFGPQSPLTKAANNYLEDRVSQLEAQLGEARSMIFIGPTLPHIPEPATTSPTIAPTPAPMPPQRPKVAIGIISSFDWQERFPYVSFRARRQLHRDTWIQHPAITERGEVKVYFIIGNQQHMAQGDPRQATHNITELEFEMDHYKDIVLLNGSDMHNYGKNNAWYEWAAATNNMDADYHVKLDDESYVVVDNLLAAVKEVPQYKFLGGQGEHVDREHPKHGLVKRSPWTRGWGYIMSDDVMKGLGNCSSSGGVHRNNGEHEDIYNGLALTVCGLDKNLTYDPGMRVHSLRHLLALGCPEDVVNGAIMIHGGMRAAQGGNPYSKVSAQTMRTLHSIYHPHVGDLAPAWTKWEALRQLYLYDLGACNGEGVKEWTCLHGGWEKNTCKR